MACPSPNPRVVSARAARARWPTRAWLGAALALCGCADDAPAPSPLDAADEPRDAIPTAPVWLDAPEGPLPAGLSEVGLFPALSSGGVPPDLSQSHPRAHAYTPTWELWTSGSAKQRLLVLPEGAKIDATDPDEWAFPDGALLFKTFSWPQPSGARPLETRVMHKVAGQWEFALYRWDEAGVDATLLPTPWLRETIELTDAAGEAFEYTVPSHRDCRSCHEASPSPALGLREVQLSEPDLSGETVLQRWHRLGLITPTPPATPRRVEHPDEETRWVLGYLTGNCVHCHNGSGLDAASFDLRHEVALDAIVGQPTESSASAAGIRVVPGDPSASVLFLALSGETDDPEVKAMPPLGVDLRDAQAIERIRAWIQALEPVP